MSAKLILALDVDARRDAERLIEALDGVVEFFKIGYQLFYGGDGLALGKALLAAGKHVFFDLKLLDIDATVERGAAAIAETGATMLTVHAYPQAMRAARRGAEGSSLVILGVSVLTSMDDADLLEAGFALDTAGLVARRAGQARDAGIGGVVCAPTEARAVRAIVGAGMAVVTPGVRPAGGGADDQKRVLAPAEAVAAGASHLVIGRPITAAPDPRAAAAAILAQV